MDISLTMVVFGIFTLYLGGKAWHILPTFYKLLRALIKGTVKWPGPRIHNPNHSASVVRARLGVGYERLFPEFGRNSMGAFAGFVFSLLMFASSLPSMRDEIRMNWTILTVILVAVAIVGSVLSYNKARINKVQVDNLLSDLVLKVEPRNVDARSSRNEYAIEHPLLGSRDLPPDSRRALDQFYESIRVYQDGDQFRALNLSNEATQVDPSLHEHVRQVLLEKAKQSGPSEAGAIHYWTGIHSEHLRDWKLAIESYQKAVDAFTNIGYKKRASQAWNNLGSVKMKSREPSAMEAYEKAVEVDPTNGIAHMNIGLAYYMISERGDPRFDIAMDAFANAVEADSQVYTPIVTNRLKSIGYTWKEDLEDIYQRVEQKRLNHRTETSLTQKDTSDNTQRKEELESIISAEDTSKWETYRDDEKGFEINLPNDWSEFRQTLPGLGSKFIQYAFGFTPNIDVAFTHGPDEIVNIVIENMTPEPPPAATEDFFRLYAQQMGYSHCKYGRITVRNKSHTWAQYQVNERLWSKKYMIVLNQKGYAITASCKSQEIFFQQEKVWDAIAASFRPIYH